MNTKQAQKSDEGNLQVADFVKDANLILRTFRKHAIDYANWLIDNLCSKNPEGEWFSVELDLHNMSEIEMYKIFLQSTK